MRRKTLSKNSFHSYQQLHSADCGQTCIRMILRHYGKKVDYGILCSMADSDRQGLTIREIVNLLDKMGIESRSLSIGIDNIKKMPLPGIIFWERNHYVVLYKIDRERNRYHIADPAKGKIRLSEEEFLKGFASNENSKGIVVALEPRSTFPEIDLPQERTVPKFLQFIREGISRYNKSMLWAVTLTLLILITDFLTPFMFQHTIDEGIRTKNVNLIWLLAASQVFLFIGNYVANSIGDFILTKVGLRTGIGLIESYIQKLLRLPLNYYNRHSPADLVQRVEDHNRIRDYLLTIPASGIFTILNILVFGAILFYYSPLIFGLFFIFSVFNFIWMLLFMRFRKEIDFSLAAKNAEVRNNVYEIIGGMEEIKMANAADARTKDWHRGQDHVNKLSLKAAYLNIYQNGGNLIWVRIRDVVITGICAVMVTQDTMTIGIMMTISYVCGQLATPFANIMKYVNSTQDALMAFQRIESVPVPEDSEVKQISIEFIDKWEVRNLCYKYPGEASPFVLKDCSFSIPAGGSIAIVGESGCGKSTLLRLLTHSYSPTSGVIMINGEKNSIYSEKSLSSLFGCVLQNGMIFSSSILENIAFADTQPDIGRVKEVAGMACIDEFISNLPLGYNTKIGKTGIELSGGQRQRLLIARALYQNPPILILDEATSSLDCATEAKIMDNIFKFSKDRTLVVAAHRLSTIYRADVIMMMADGKIVEMGSHPQLMQLGGQYAKLVQSQLIDRDP